MFRVLAREGVRRIGDRLHTSRGLLAAGVTRSKRSVMKINNSNSSCPRSQDSLSVRQSPEHADRVDDSL